MDFAAAVEIIEKGHFGCMVALDPPDVQAVPLDEALDLQELPEEHRPALVQAVIDYHVPA